MPSSIDKIKSAFSRGDDKSVEDKIKELEQEKKKLEKEHRTKQLEKEVEQLKGNGGGGIRSKLGQIADDFSKRGKNGEDSAISILVGPPEDGQSTEDFVVGGRRQKDDYPLETFILGGDMSSESDMGISFPHDATDEDLDDIMEETIGV